MVDTKKIVGFNVTWQADHEQYWQGHGVAFTDYDECATGCGDTLREAFEDALESLAQQDIRFTDEQEKELLAELQSQAQEPEMLDWDIVRAECPKLGAHCNHFPVGSPMSQSNELCAECEDSVDCAVCAGEWHFYVNVDVKVEEVNPVAEGYLKALRQREG